MFCTVAFANICGEYTQRKSGIPTRRRSRDGYRDKSAIDSRAFLFFRGTSSAFH